jgi:hypothetical protein
MVTAHTLRGNLTDMQTISPPLSPICEQVGSVATRAAFLNGLGFMQSSKPLSRTSRTLRVLQRCRGEADGPFLPLSKKLRLSRTEKSFSCGSLAAFASFGKPHPGIFPATDDLRNETFPGRDDLARTEGGCKQKADPIFFPCMRRQHSISE